MVLMTCLAAVHAACFSSPEQGFQGYSEIHVCFLYSNACALMGELSSTFWPNKNSKGMAFFLIWVIEKMVNPFLRERS